MEDLHSLQSKLRRDVLEMVFTAKAGHIGGDFSVMDILIALYFCQMNTTPSNGKDPDRDRFILSKGHSVEAYYAVLAAKGFLKLDDVVHGLCQFGTLYIGHPNNKLPGIEMNSGSLGHGLSTAVGMALAGKMDGLGYRVYTVMGDGELAEGSVWEGAMAGAQYGLDNLCAVVDRNGLQISGKTTDVMSTDSLPDRWRSFGWHVEEVDGHELDALNMAFSNARATVGKPTIIIANTVKGKGVSFMENRMEWHHKVPNQAEYAEAMAELAAGERRGVA